MRGDRATRSGDISLPRCYGDICGHGDALESPWSLSKPFKLSIHHAAATAAHLMLAAIPYPGIWE